MKSCFMISRFMILYSLIFYFMNSRFMILRFMNLFFLISCILNSYVFLNSLVFRRFASIFHLNDD